MTELKEIPHLEYRDTAYIRGRLVDQSGQLVKGAYFQIRNDSYPNQFIAAEPHGNAPADGTATFVVTRGRFAVRILGGRSEDAGWMVTGTGNGGPLSDWEFTFQETEPIAAGTIVSPTPTFTATVTTATPLPVVLTQTSTPAPPTATNAPIAPTATPVAPTRTPVPVGASPTSAATAPVPTSAAPKPTMAAESTAATMRPPVQPKASR